MNLPFEYDQPAPSESSAAPRRPPPISTTRASSSCRFRSIAPRRTSPGTRNGPHEILVASSHMELWDEETETDVHSIGIFTLPEMEFPFASMDEVVREIRRVAVGDRHARQVPDRPRRRAFDHAAGGRRRRGETSRACRCCRSTRTPTCATRSWARRTTTRARCGACSSSRATTQVGIRSLSPEEAAAAPALPTDDLLRLQHAARTRTGWIASSTRSARRSTSPSTSTASTRRSCRPPARPSRAAWRGTKRWRCCAA